jgi:formamidopyrimidine-DNA glycosylase
MPELPEVNTVMRGFHKTVLNIPVVKVEVHDSKIIRNTSAEKFMDAITGHSFVDTYRQGKYFFGILENGVHILFHLGMTGHILYYTAIEDRPKYERFNIKFKDGLILGFDDVRKFSHILVIENLPDYLTQIKLGPDALLISLAEFMAILSNRNTTLKAVLLNQQLVAGIGNLYADEICYQAKIHPGSTAGKLNKKRIRIIFNLMQKILTEACIRDAYYKVYPEDWFWKWRSEEHKIIKGKGIVAKSKIAGRTTYFVEGYQELVK